MPKNNSKKVSFERFEGIDVRESYHGKKSIYDINNFRVTDKGVLKKREGYKYILRLGSTIRDIWSGRINGKFYCFFLTGKYVYLLDTETGDYTSCGSISSASGDAKFFYYIDTLYLSDTQNVYVITENNVYSVIGYVPLYGKDWPTTYAGEVNEPLNIMNARARISYKVPADYTSMLPTKLPVKSIISVYKNDVLLSYESYRYDADLKAISVPGIVAGDRLLVTVVFDVDIGTDHLLSCPYTAVFGGANNSRVFMWKSNDSTLFPASYVSKSSLAESEKLFPRCSPLYFKEGHEFIVGEGRHSIKSVLRHYDRLLIFTEEDTWMADSNIKGDEEFPLMNINSSFGCASDLGSVMAGNDPLTIGKTNILRWTSDTDELNECNAYSISEPINERLSPDFFKDAIVFKDAYRNEIWFHNSSMSNDIWIYNLQNKAWVRFSDITASMFFDANGDVGFAHIGDIYKFSDSYYDDKISGFSSKEIVASVTSGAVDFGSANPKHLSSYAFKGELDSGDVQISISTNKGEEITDTISSGSNHIFKLKRLHSGRFSLLKNITLTCGGTARQIVGSIEINAR